MRIKVKKGIAGVITKKRSVTIGASKTGVAVGHVTGSSVATRSVGMHNGPLKSKSVHKSTIAPGVSGLNAKHYSVNAKHAGIAAGAGVAGAVGVHAKRGSRSINKHPMRRPMY